MKEDGEKEGGRGGGRERRREREEWHGEEIEEGGIDGGRY